VWGPSLLAVFIFLGSLVRVFFIVNVCIVSDQTSEAGNVSTALNYMPEVASDSSYDFKKMLESCPQKL
jgi:hypothetical protein